MIELMRTNNAVLLSFAEATLRSVGIEALRADTHMAQLEGSIGALPQRLLVSEDDLPAARAALVDAGLAGELSER